MSNLAVYAVYINHPFDHIPTGDYHHMFVIAENADQARKMAFNKAVHDGGTNTGVWMDEFATVTAWFDEAPLDATEPVIRNVEVWYGSPAEKFAALMRNAEPRTAEISNGNVMQLVNAMVTAGELDPNGPHFDARVAELHTLTADQVATLLAEWTVAAERVRAVRPVVVTDWDGHSNPVYAYADQMELSRHLRDGIDYRTVRTDKRYDAAIAAERGENAAAIPFGTVR